MVTLPTPREAAERLLGRAPDHISTLVRWRDHGAYRVDAGGDSFVVKLDDDPELVAREVAGHQRAAAAGVPVPELIMADDHCIAMRFVDGTPLHESATEAAWRAAGSALRQVHDLTPGDLIGDGFGLAGTTWPEFVEALLERELEGCGRELGFDPSQAKRVRRAFDDARPLLDQPVLVWCHGDCQPDHVLVDPHDDSVVAIIDWADHGKGDSAWDLAILSLDHTSHIDALLDGYGEVAVGADRTRTVLSLYRVLRWLREARWLAARSLPESAVSLEQATTWSPPR